MRPLRGLSPIKATEPSPDQPVDAVAAQVLRALRGDAAAEAWIAERAYRAGLRLATFSLGDGHLAQDVGQEVAIRVLRGLPKLRDAAKFDGWTYRICAAEIKRAATKRRRRETREVADPGIDLPVDPSFSRLLEERDWLAGAIAELSQRQRLVLGLRYVFELEDEEIAAALGSRRGTVRSLASRAVARLRRRAEKEDRAALQVTGDRPRTEVTR